jgi:uncharacterized protein DUF2806
MSDNLPTPTNWWTSLLQGTTAISKSVVKLIDTVGEQIGLFLEPTHIRRKGQAKADTTVINAKAEADVAMIQLQGRLALLDTQDRAYTRVKRKEEKRQKNIEAVVAQSALSLPEAVSEEPVDEDWVTQFFNYCQDVGNEEMQSLWARLLAGEVAKPGSFSMRTLALVRVMSKEDANLFTRFCSMVWQTPEGMTPITPLEEYLRRHMVVSLDLLDLAYLDTLGLIRFDPHVMHTLTVSNPRQSVWSYHGLSYILHCRGLSYIRRRPGKPDIQIGNAILTVAGKELAVIAGSTPNEKYINWAIEHLRGQGWWIVECSGKKSRALEHEATKARAADETGNE